MNIRNFWIEGRIDGRETILSGGPQSKTGGFDITIKQRHRGSIINALTVVGHEKDGKLTLTVYRKTDNEQVYMLTTER